MAVGSRIASVRAETDGNLIARAAALPVANLGNVMNRLQAMRGGFRAYGGRRAVVGPALTVKARPGDNLFLHRAMDLARPGDVIVCDGGGDLGIALSGDLMIGHAASCGIAGLVTDGAVRDVATIATMDIGVWARGATPAGPFKDGPGEIGHPVACGGQVVMIDDLIAADEDGVVVIPAAERHAAGEVAATAAIQGVGWNRDWVVEALRAKGVEGA